MTTAERIKALAAYGANLEDAMERFVNDEALYIECIQLFLEEENLEELGRALEEGDTARAFAAAHAIKGVAGNLALKPLYDVMHDIVEPLRTGRPGDLGTQYAALLKQYDALAALMR